MIQNLIIFENYFVLSIFVNLEKGLFIMKKGFL